MSALATLLAAAKAVRTPRPGGIWWPENVKARSQALGALESSARSPELDANLREIEEALGALEEFYARKPDGWPIMRAVADRIRAALGSAGP